MKQTRYWLQLCLATMGCVMRGIAHQDLKEENIILDLESDEVNLLRSPITCHFDELCYCICILHAHPVCSASSFAKSPTKMETASDVPPLPEEDPWVPPEYLVSGLHTSIAALYRQLRVWQSIRIPVSTPPRAKFLTVSIFESPLISLH